MKNSPNHDKNLNDTKWNREQHFEQHREFNEGFSNENLPEDYDPSQMKPETETDEEGNIRQVERARYTDLQNEETPDETGKIETGNEAIEPHEQNRDFNYDPDPERHPDKHPEKDKNRGNIDFGK
ncbi:MAG TPA: hypothetical protein VF676_06765 [Flavobacterium sp.]|jgi:hypothetical protein